jgi:stalled ribosome rescue protein Dom34
VILPTDIPTRAEIDRLLELRAPSSVSIYLPTDPASNGDAERIEFKTLAAEASSQLREVHELYEQRSADGRALSDVAEVARAVTAGAVETLLVDIDATVPGSVDDKTGAVAFAGAAAGDVHDVSDEIARRAWLSGARVLAVRGRDVPGGGAVAAILRYPL